MLNRSQGPSPVISEPETPSSQSELGVKGREGTEIREPPVLHTPLKSGLDRRWAPEDIGSRRCGPLQDLTASGHANSCHGSGRAFAHLEGSGHGCGLTWKTVACALQVKGE